MAQIGEVARFVIKDQAQREFECEGIIYGRVNDRGGKKWLIKNWTIISPETIGVRNIISSHVNIRK